MATRSKAKARRVRYKDTEFLRALGEKLRKVRRAKGYSIDRLYLETPHLSRSTISRIERGEADPQVSTLKRIAETLGVPLESLIKV